MKLGSYNEGLGRLRRGKIPGYYSVSRSNNVLSQENTKLCEEPDVWNPLSTTLPHTADHIPSCSLMGWWPTRRVMWLAEGQSNRSLQKLVCSRFSVCAGRRVRSQIGGRGHLQTVCVEVSTKHIPVRLQEWVAQTKYVVFVSTCFETPL